MKLFSRKYKPTKVISIDPFTVEVYDVDDIKKCKVVVTISNKSVRYEFRPNSEAYWFILCAGDDLDATRMFLTTLTLSSNMLCNDEKFLSDILNIVEDAVRRNSDKAEVGASSITDNDEEYEQLFMKGVAKEIDKRKTGEK